MTLRDFIDKLLGRQPASANVARERLQLVLAHDRSDLNPELLEQMRREILEVVQRYVEIDLECCDVSLETEDRVTALLANLPIKRTREVPLPRSEESAAEGGADAPSPQAEADEAAGGGASERHGEGEEAPAPTSVPAESATEVLTPLP